MLTATLTATVLLCAISARPAVAQGGRPPSLNEFALGWLVGSYTAPLVCVLNGEPRRGLRRIVISPGSKHARPPVAKISFIDIRPESASRCFSAFVKSEPNLTETFEIHIENLTYHDTGARDFKT